ncbi:ATP-dependent DNA ligase [Nocardia speluncae]|uniref:DNA ligase (ATP) n=2 Tax=Nocardia speluncae TaxID=419477 RepID=A0A846XJN0_9NOCA|nr:ATP-dependent DNA ligase [Nocardia speluncae]
MLATAGSPPDPALNWRYEMKWDGQRAVSRCGEGGCRFWSRNLREATEFYPDLAGALSAATAEFDGGLVLDGEIVAPDPATGAPDFARLQQRMHSKPTSARLAGVRVEYVVFDVLFVDAVSTMDKPYLARREILDDLTLEGGLIRVPPFWTALDPEHLLAAAAQAGLEGIVSKRADSRYRPGTRSRDWIKSALRRTAEGVIVAWLPGNGAFADTLGSLVLGAHENGPDLRFIGSVGTGFTMADRRKLRAALDGIARTTSPLRAVPAAISKAARWVDPVLVADVEYRELTGDGVLRHPSFRGLRPDRSPDEITAPQN